MKSSRRSRDTHTPPETRAGKGTPPAHEHNRAEFITERSGFLILAVALLWFCSLPLAITNRSASALFIYAAGLMLCGCLLLGHRGARNALRKSRTATVEKPSAQPGEQPVLASTHDTSAALGEIDATVRHILNGTLSARVPLFEDRQLWHVANGLNYVFARLERYSESEATLQRTQRQVVVVVEGIRTMRAGGIPLWPRPARTPLDAIVAELAPENEPDVLDSASRYSFPIPTEHNSEAAYDG